MNDNTMDNNDNDMNVKTETTSYNHNNIELNDEDKEQHEFLKRRMEEIEKEEKQKEAERIKKQQEYQAEFLNYLNNRKKQKVFKQLLDIWLNTKKLKKIGQKLKIIKADDNAFVADNMEFFNNINLNDSNLNENDKRVCRICFGGVNDVLESGKLISPCKCKGSMKYVHVNCLNEWRLASANKASYYQCDQCKYKYNFQRTKLANFISNKFSILLITILLTYLYIFFTGFVFKAIIQLKNYKIGVFEFPKISFFNIGLEHHFYGFCAIGVYGALKMTFSYLFDVTAITNDLFRLVRRRRRNNRDDDELTIIILLVVGLIKFMYDEYKDVYKKSKESLTILEERILEVDDDDNNDDDDKTK
ncbi:hypothetical protein BCR36DRAFT_320399 [Piromyces finnis]|uniref:RING-CH-type domain-containing protein n=1 Tax=Piromyces finnis TaxID=1754191 RepID=A0A1Y1VGM9_9FUNG|nr:hypothetical protein BCR36DRAFT_320399 [Piromyces finnis]|eukprot:ORX55859.1 hypothetical protein BCR36DRAFT_320399 [Piromyces finnis]